MNLKKVSRNAPCPCDSGKKYKQCCQARDEQKNTSNTRLRESVPDLFREATRYQTANDLTKAEDIYRQILTISPKHIETLNNLGMLLSETARIEMAIDMLNKVVRLEPSARRYQVLAQIFVKQGQDNKAIDCLRQAIQLNPGDAIAYHNLGTQLWVQHRYSEAIPYFQKSLTLDPKQDVSLNNLASCLMKQGKHQEAETLFRQSILTSPKNDSHYNNLLMSLCFDRDNFPDIYLKEASRLDLLLQSRSKSYKSWEKASLLQPPPLRVGFVSGDFRNHPVGYFLESVITHLDKSKIELFAYDCHQIEDSLTKRIKPHFSQWCNINTMSDRLAAEKIHNDGIHILIDLAGHTSNNRLAVFAWKPAPIQASWLGYFASTGLSCMDYILADPISVPEQNRSHFTETVAYLPDTRLCFTPPSADIAQNLTPLPALERGFITFGCFQSLSKVNTKVLKLWANVLEKCPNSRLLIKSHPLKEAASKQEFIEKMTACHIPMERVILEGGSPREAYLSAYANVDIMLDTFPYPGGTTTCEALWMGVPTLTLTGNTLLEKQGASMLNCVGLEDWIAVDEEDYINKAVNTANQLDKLAQLRAQLRQQMIKSPLTDAPLFALNLSQALQAMWQKWANQR
ncbi:tetratricopeptide repeat protein [Moraxellaceae bacterium AER2_44_116]|nr:tetratricopeptide repeat protein [Moraxellaceae bacterium]TQC95873.1 tetratricopeptide repeat protein [Moraxellaceae bacterium AER2_44_116]